MRPAASLSSCRLPAFSARASVSVADAEEVALALLPRAQARVAAGARRPEAFADDHFSPVAFPVAELDGSLACCSVAAAPDDFAPPQADDFAEPETPDAGWELVD
jgi:hypothetical protein